MTLLYFKANWCGVCHAISDSIPIEHAVIDCDQDQETPKKYKVMGLPTFIAVDDEGSEISRTQTSNMASLTKWYTSLGQ